MIRLEALRIYKREFFHGLRNGLSDAQAADQAMSRVKERTLDDLKGLDDYTRREKWGEIMEAIVDWQILLRDLPIDIDKIPSKEEMIEKELESLNPLLDLEDKGT